MNEKGKAIRNGQHDTICGFLERIAQTPVPTHRPHAASKLIFALDATASREATWLEARRHHSAMFDEASAFGGLSLQLCYYRGLNDFVTTPWLSDAASLKFRMNAVECLGGLTQIGRVLDQAMREARRDRLHALVFIGDCVEESPDPLCHLAGQLGIMRTPIFVFQEGHDAEAELTFRQFARLSQGAYCRFDAGSARQLRDLLEAVGAYASGGLPALQRLGRRRGGLALHLAHQISPGS